MSDVLGVLVVVFFVLVLSSRLILLLVRWC